MFFSTRYSDAFGVHDPFFSFSFCLSVYSVERSHLSSFSSSKLQKSQIN